MLKYSQILEPYGLLIPPAGPHTWESLSGSIIDGFVKIIDRRGSQEGRWKGVVFGQKGNSRSGYFQSSAVKIIEKPETGFVLMSLRTLTY
ncbi:hypothetical protein ANCCEY_04152 [Ancylostoma ceylanicum]|uniref:SH3 domain-containing protein n=1 Tax=Ancylostoma ceylanicum TaxID=53326 RepID=A0A0D6M316_9BILA|nr:hypothetical protein ANCCEY_04152 [Ancylostoma ceylanicum]